jgi:hypothetical protein
VKRKWNIGNRSENALSDGLAAVDKHVDNVGVTCRAGKHQGRVAFDHRGQHRAGHVRPRGETHQKLTQLFPSDLIEREWLGGARLSQSSDL